MIIVPLEPRMQRSTKAAPKPATANEPKPIPVKIPEEVHRMLRFVQADTGENLGEIATRFMLAGGLKEAAQKARA